ncbi:hypothetical protein ABQE93_10545 [Mycolicibacterium sp. XJ662]
MSTLVSTDRMLAQSGHRLVGTTVCGSDADLTARLHGALVEAELTNVVVVSPSDALTAVTRAVVGGETAASMTSDGSTAALSIVDPAADVTSLIAVEPVTGGDRTAAYRKLLERFSEEPGGATSVVVLGPPLDDAVTAELNATSPVPLRFPEHPEFALARGAALAGFGRQQVSRAVEDYPAASLNSADTMLGVQAQQLAYSQVEDSGDFGLVGADVPLQTPMQPLSAVDPEEFETEEEDVAPNRPRVLLLGSTVAAVVVVGFAALAVSVAINIRPTASVQDVRLQEEAVAGKYFPNSPGQGVHPNGPNWTMIEERPEPGTEPDARVFRPQSLGSSGGTGDAGAEVIKFFRDGTVGVVPDVVTLPPPPPPGGVGPGVFAQPPEFLTRLIPDFSRWSPCQILALVGNMGAFAQATMDAATDVTTAGFETLGSVTGGLNELSEAGELVTTPVTKANLFDTSEESDSATDLEAIPEQIFETGSSQLTTADVLPSDTKIVETKTSESLPGAGSADTVTSVPPLGELIPETVEKSLPGVQGTGPIVLPESEVLESAPGSEVPLPASVPEIPGAVPGDTSPAESVPSEDIANMPPLPGGSEPVQIPKPQEPLEVPKPVEVPKPQVPADIPEPVEIPKPPVPVEVPKPPVPVEIPKPPAPVEVPKPQVPVEIPKPPAPVEIPKPQVPVEIPKPPAPVIQAPAPPAPAPAPPVLKLPTKLPIPTKLIPAPKAPTPKKPSLPATTLPKLPFGKDLFGSGSS